MSKIIKILILFFTVLGVLVLAIFVANYIFQNKLKKIETSISPEDFEKFKSLSVEKINLNESYSTQTQEFVSPDGKLKLEYSGWLAVTDKKTLDSISSDKISKEYGVKTLLFAQKFKLNGSFAQLVVNEGFFKEKNKAEDIISLMQESNKELGNEMKIIKLEENILEATYQKDGQPAYHSLEKIILNKSEEEPKTYIIAILSLDSIWPDFEEEAKSILSSIQLSE